MCVFCPGFLRPLSLYIPYFISPVEGSKPHANFWSTSLLSFSHIYIYRALTYTAIVMSTKKRKARKMEYSIASYRQSERRDLHLAHCLARRKGRKIMVGKRFPLLWHCRAKAQKLRHDRKFATCPSLQYGRRDNKVYTIVEVVSNEKHAIA